MMKLTLKTIDFDLTSHFLKCIFVLQTSITRALVFFTRISSLLFIGRMDSDENLAAASLANSVANVVGIVVLMSFVGKE